MRNDKISRGYIIFSYYLYIVIVSGKLQLVVFVFIHDPLLYIQQEQQISFIFKPVNPSQVLNALKNLKNGKATGPDKIPVTLVKDASEFISLPLTLIYNSSLKNGIFPDIWKLARVAPIFKSGKRDDTNNYMPISILSIFSRVFDKIVHDQLQDFLRAHGILTKNQNAFQKLCSTITSLISSSENWLKNTDDHKLNLTLFLDLKKVFDTVDHKILISKVVKYGVRGIEIEWFKSYLKERRQYCSINGQKSEIKDVRCGIPQGSCLGPLLFIVFLNDFEGYLDYSKASMYADDTHTTVAASDIEDLISMTKEELSNISDWLRLKTHD